MRGHGGGGMGDGGQGGGEEGRRGARAGRSSSSGLRNLSRNFCSAERISIGGGALFFAFWRGDPKR